MTRVLIYAIIYIEMEGVIYMAKRKVNVASTEKVETPKVETQETKEKNVKESQRNS